MNLVVQGPSGVGKTAAVRALAREVHTDPGNDLIELNVIDFFNRTGKQVRADPWFEQFLDDRSRMARCNMIDHVLKESVGYVPMSGGYKTIVLDNIESIRENFQQTLHYVMGQYHRTMQLVITIRQPSRLIPPIRSWCFPVPMPAPNDEVLEALLVDTLDTEGVGYDAGDLQFLTDASNGNVRKAVLSTQRTATETDEVTMLAVHAALDDVGSDDELKTLLTNAREGNIKDAHKTLTMFFDDEGYEGQELLADILHIADSTPERFADGGFVRLHELAGQVDPDISTGTDDRLYIAHFLTG